MDTKGHGQACWTGWTLLGENWFPARVLWSAQEVVQLRVLCSVGRLCASLRSSVSVTIPIITSHRPLGTTHVCGDILLVHGNGWRNWLPGLGWEQMAELVVKGCGLSSCRLLVMSLRGAHLHSCLWMLLGATLALGQGQGKFFFLIFFRITGILQI